MTARELALLGVLVLVVGCIADANAIDHNAFWSTISSMVTGIGAGTLFCLAAQTHYRRRDDARDVLRALERTAPKPHPIDSAVTRLLKDWAERR